MLLPVLLAAAAPVRAAPAQDVLRRSWAEATVGDELESYLRALQVAGAAPMYPWGIRGFSARQVEALAAGLAERHPWRDRFEGHSTHPAAVRYEVVRPSATLIENTGFPYGGNDGPVWAGRGVTSVVSAGLGLYAGPLSVRFRPIAFRAENAGFRLVSTGLPGRLRFADPVTPTVVDAPQRFGDTPYQRVDLGESSVRLEAFGVAVGGSTESQDWGPSSENPLVLGHNAGGFPHVLIGTAAPVSVGVGRLHARAIAGRLAESAYSPAPADSSGRVASGLVVSFMPRGLTGLELGGMRFTQTLRQGGGIRVSDLRRPLQNFFFHLGATDPGTAGANDLASVFFRWVIPRAGTEVYGEYAREDRAANVRDLLGEPDHSAAFTLGLRHAWLADQGRRLVVVRGELVDARTTHLERVRLQGRYYTHFAIRQGQTQRGQILGSLAAFGGGGSDVGADWYGSRGRVSLDWQRLDRNAGGVEGLPLGVTDVSHALLLDGVRYIGGIDVTGTVGAVYELNRGGERDAFNLELKIGARVGFGRGAR